MHPHRHLLALLLTLSLLLAASPAAAAGGEELTPEKSADILALMRQSGSDKVAVALGVALARQITSAVHAARPDIPKRALQVVERELAQMLRERMDGPNGMLARMVPVYADAFTHDEIRQMLEFYQSPVGRKAVLMGPQLMVQGQRIGQQMANELKPEMRERLAAALKREGVTLKGGELKNGGGKVLDQMPGQEGQPGQDGTGQ